MDWTTVVNLTGLRVPNPSGAEEILDYRPHKAKTRFYADENFPALATSLLRKLGANVVTAHETKSSKQAGEDNAGYARRAGCVLLSRDRNYLDERRFPSSHCPAIVVVDFGSSSREEILGVCACLARILLTPKLFDKCAKIAVDRGSRVEYFRRPDGKTRRARYRLPKNRALTSGKV